MGSHVIFYDATGAKASDFKYVSAKVAGERYDICVKRLKDHADDVYASVALVEDGKELKRYPEVKAKAD